MMTITLEMGYYNTIIESKKMNFNEVSEWMDKCYLFDNEEIAKALKEDFPNYDFKVTSEHDNRGLTYEYQNNIYDFHHIYSYVLRKFDAFHKLNKSDLWSLGMLVDWALVNEKFSSDVKYEYEELLTEIDKLQDKFFVGNGDNEEKNHSAYYWDVKRYITKQFKSE